MSTFPPNQRISRRHRRGTIYLMVMLAALVVSLLGLGAITRVRIQQNQLGLSRDTLEARNYARAAVDMALLRMATDPAWRTKMRDGTWDVDQSIENGKYRFQGTDPLDGDLLNNDDDPVLIVGTGTSGGARHKIEAQVQPEIVPLSCLESALHAEGDITFLTGVSASSDATISSNNDVDAQSASIAGAVEAAGLVTGSSYFGAATSGADARDLPAAATVFDYYIANGTAISLADLPLVAGSYRIENVVLAAGYNPFPGGTNAEGIYVIDCGLQPVHVRNARIHGTLVLLNAPPVLTDGCRVSDNVHWEPFVADYPALLVQGDLIFSTQAAGLDEAALVSNFNPLGAPHQGQEDSDLVDVYPAQLRGLFYTSGDLQIWSDWAGVDGVVTVGNRLDTVAGKHLSITYDPGFLQNPPPGFQSGRVFKIDPASVRRVVD